MMLTPPPPSPSLVGRDGKGSLRGEAYPINQARLLCLLITVTRWRLEMTFNEWINRPLYRVHVTTWNQLLRLFNIDPDKPLVTSGNHPIAEFRVLPKYRTVQSLKLRKLVADRMRLLRREHGRKAIIQWVEG
jgi:hypothetical protein